MDSYGPDELQKIKFFRVYEGVKDTIVFIHGGGWRDPCNTFDDFAPLMGDFEHLNVNLASINYRLSPKVSTPEELEKLPSFKHPFHLIDVVNALVHLVKQGFNIILLVGHSVGASLGFQLLNYESIIRAGLKYTAEPKQDIRSESGFESIRECLDKVKLKNLFLLDGIYSVEDLLKEYDYMFFIRSAFGCEDHWKDAFGITNSKIGKPASLMDSQTKIYVIHSLEDELLSTRQSEILGSYLKKCRLPYKMIFKNFGPHEEVYTRKEISDIINQALV